MTLPDCGFGGLKGRFLLLAGLLVIFDLLTSSIRKCTTILPINRDYGHGGSADPMPDLVLNLTDIDIDIDCSDYVRRTVNETKDSSSPSSLIFDPQLGFQSKDGKHVPREEVIGFAQSTIRDYLKPLIRTDKPIALINLHIQSNVGDTALMSAELQVLRDLGVKQDQLVVNTTVPPFTGMIGWGTMWKLKNTVNAQGGTVLFAAGGNMGTIYWANQRIYNLVVKMVPNARVIHLPQSLVVKDLHKFNQTTGKIYRNHPDLHIFMRDKASYDIATQLQLSPNTKLCPDLAFYLGDLSHRLRNIKIHSKSILWMKRADAETPKVSKEQQRTLSSGGASGNSNGNGGNPHLKGLIGPTDWRGTNCPKSGPLREHANSALRHPDTKELYYEAELQRGSELLGQGAVVMTDRLHGQILSFLLGLPVVVLRDKTYKGKHFFDTWTHVSSSNTKYANTTTIAIATAHAMLDCVA